MPSSDDGERKQHGQLARAEQQHGFDLSGVDLHSLLIEVWNRLERGEQVDGSEWSIAVGDAVADRLGIVLDVHGNRFARTRYFDLFGMFHRDLERPRPPIADARYLDLGCGSINPLGYGLLMVMLGARSFVGVDLDEVQDPARSARGMARLVDMVMQDPERVIRDHRISRGKVLANLRRAEVDVDALRDGDIDGRGPRLSLLHESAESLSVGSGSIDVVTSSSFLEHVEDIEAVVEEVARVTAPGGFSVHAIDGKDHWSYDSSDHGALDFLRESGTGMLHSSNRIRPLEFQAVFERHGFRVQQAIVRETVPLSDEDVARFADPWRSMPREVLEPVYVTIVARRDDDPGRRRRRRRLRPSAGAGWSPRR